jgi:hypothetical protein
MLLDITRQTPLLPQTSSAEIKRSILVEASDSASTLRNFSAPPTTGRKTERIADCLLTLFGELCLVTLVRCSATAVLVTADNNDAAASCKPGCH